MHVCKSFYIYLVYSPEFMLVLLPLRCKTHQLLLSPRNQNDVLKCCCCSFVLSNIVVFCEMIDLFLMWFLLAPQGCHTSSLCRKWMYSKNRCRESQHPTCDQTKVREHSEKNDAAIDNKATI